MTNVRRKKYQGFTLIVELTCSLQIKHFFTRGEHIEHVAIWEQGMNKTSRGMSEQTIQLVSGISAVAEAALFVNWLPDSILNKKSNHSFTRELIDMNQWRNEV